MRKYLVAVVVMGVLAAAACSARGQVDQSAYRAVMEKNLKDYSTNCLSGDANRYVSEWDENGVQYPPESPMVIGKAAITESMKGFFAAFKFTTFDITLVEARKLSPDMGFVTLTYSYQAVPRAGGQGFSFQGKDLCIWKKQADGSWKLLHDIFNSNAPSS